MLDLRKAQRVALYASVATVLLDILKAIVGCLAGSVVLIADAVHSGTDVVCVLASWFGLRLASRAAHTGPSGPSAYTGAAA